MTDMTGRRVLVTGATASSPEVQKVTGGDFAREKPKTPSKHSQEDAAAERLWALSEQLTGLGGASRAA